MESPDPFPALAYPEALRMLREWLGETAVRWTEPFGPAVMKLPCANGESHLRRFTWRQAKYLALNPGSFHGVMLGHFPIDWPA